MPADTKYVVFACDPKPGVEVPVTSEFWPSDSGWPKSMPPMGKNNCSHCITDGTPCPYKTQNLFADDKSVTACGCCTTCAAPDGSYPARFNLTVSNPTTHSWKLQLYTKDPTSPYSFGKQTYCNMDPLANKQMTWSEQMQYQTQTDASVMEIAPGATNVVVGVPPNVLRLEAVPLYTAGAHACVVDGWQSRWGPPHSITLDDQNVDTDCASP